MNLRLMWRHPAVVGAVVVSVVCGAIGSSAGTAFLAEPNAPGLFGSLTAGIAGSAALALFWSVPLAAVVIGRSVKGPRVVQFAAGTTQWSARWNDLRRLTIIVFSVAAFGMLGGITASVGQLAAGFGWGINTPHSVPFRAVAELALALVGSSVLGVLLASAFESVTVALFAYFGSLMATGILVAGSYFVDGLHYIAAAMPWAPLFLLARSQTGARELWLHTSVPIAVAATSVWIVAIAGLAFRRSRREVS